MPGEWANDLHLEFDARAGRRAAIERALREAVRDGRLRPGVRLPATRTLAADLGVARGTVAEAYAQLTAEGFLTARQGAGTVVATTAPGPERRSATVADAAPDPPPRFDLRPGTSDASAFPRAVWLHALRRALREAPDVALRSDDVRGHPGLRAALADHVGRTRGVVADPSRLVVCNGFAQGFDLLCRALADLGAGRIALEDPCLADLPQVAARAGLTVADLRIDGHGAVTDGLDGADAALLTPAHQFPLGATLAPERRAAFVAWARERDGWVLEDDYDGEFRYDRQSVGALQGLDPERVVYAGTASKTLAPGIRLGWLVLPEPLVAPVAEAKALADRGTSSLEQLALAELLRSGALDRHVRRMRLVYRRRRDALLAMLARRAPALRPVGIAAGLHLVLELPADGPTEAEVHTRAAAARLAVGRLSTFRRHVPPEAPEGLVVGYGAVPGHAFAGAVEALGDVLTAPRCWTPRPAREGTRS